MQRASKYAQHSIANTEKTNWKRTTAATTTRRTKKKMRELTKWNFQRQLDEVEKYTNNER